jgi:ParB family chromosome partitioning protein
MAETGRTRLGKGLSALLGEIAPESSAGTAEPLVREIPVGRCAPNPHQPRDRFDPDRERELAASVRERGVLQPILVTPDGEGGYRIVAGERRWRAARTAGFETVPAIVKKLEPREMIELALVENLQREDLNAIEEARGYRELIEDFGLTQLEAAERVGKDRSTVANALRLLELPAPVQEMVESGALSMGHARSLLGLSDPAAQVRLARDAAARGLSVRQVEAAVRRARAPGSRRPARAAGSAQARFYEQELQRALGTRVRILEEKKGAGRIQIAYHSAEEFERLHVLLVGR